MRGLAERGARVGWAASVGGPLRYAVRGRSSARPGGSGALSEVRVPPPAGGAAAVSRRGAQGHVGSGLQRNPRGAVRGGLPERSRAGRLEGTAAAGVGGAGSVAAGGNPGFLPAGAAARGRGAAGERRAPAAPRDSSGGGPRPARPVPGVTLATKVAARRAPCCYLPPGYTSAREWT